MVLDVINIQGVKKKKITREGQLMMLILNGKLKTKYYEADK